MVRMPVAAALALVLASIHPAGAQEWPARTLTMVVPFPAGGPIDVVGRILAPPMAEILGQQIIIENVGGAGGSTGSSRVAKAAPDGYQFLIGNSGTHTYSQLLTKKPPYDAVADFAPVAVFVENSKVLTTRKDLPADTLPEFIAYAKANQATMQYGSAGAGSATHMTCVLLNAAIGVDVTHVPYRGTGPAMQDLMGGRIDYICDVISTALPLIRSNSIKPIALLSPRRNAVLPEVATADEQGLAGFDADAWNAFFLPRGTPRADRASARAGDERRAGSALGARAARGPRPQRAGPGAAHAGISRKASAERAREMGRAGQGERRGRRRLSK
jgi:tripartite-type tricarboxylate transporter receptor subunit TctC